MDTKSLTELPPLWWTRAALLQRRIDQTDRQIDFLVYELYGLTDTEIKIVETA